MAKYLAYVRGSKEDVDVQNQIFAIQKWAEENGHEIVQLFADEDVSGWKVEPKNRPAFREILEFSQKTGIKNIVFYSIDRLARRIDDGLEIVKFFKKHNYTVKFIKEEWIENIGSESTRDLMTALQLFGSQFYAETVSTKVKDAIAKRKAEVDPLNVFDSGWSQGKLKTKDGNKPQRRIIDPVIFSRIAQLRRAGYSWQAIANQLGMKSKATPYMAWKRVRERVLQLREQGYSLKEIAEHSGVSVKVLREVIK